MTDDPIMFFAHRRSDLEAVLDGCDASPYERNTREQVARVRAALEQAFTVEDVAKQEDYYGVLAELRRRLAPPVEHKVTLRIGDVLIWLICSCGWESGPLASDPFEPGRLAQAHLSKGEMK